jgi:hypothetical protein
VGSGETRFGEKSDRANSREHHLSSVACYLSNVNYYLNSDYVRTCGRAWCRWCSVAGALEEKDLTQRPRRSERRGRGERQEGFPTTRTPFGMTGRWAECWVERLRWRRDPCTARRGRRDASVPSRLRVNGMTGLGPYSFPFANPSSNLLPQNGQNIIFVPLPALGSSESV